MDNKTKKQLNLDSIKNPTREIFFFRHDKKKLVYVLMSLQIGKEEFFNMFPAAQEITEEDCDTLVLGSDFKVVYVGDDHIIDNYFTANKNKRKKAS